MKIEYTRDICCPLWLYFCIVIFCNDLFTCINTNLLFADWNWKQEENPGEFREDYRRLCGNEKRECFIDVETEKAMIKTVITEWFQYKDGLFRYSNLHCKDKLVMRLSHLYNGNSYITKMPSFYWNITQRFHHENYVKKFIFHSLKTSSLYSYQCITA